MSASRPLEEQLLRHADAALRTFSAPYGEESFEARLEALEATASRIGGFSLKDFHTAFSIKPIANPIALDTIAKKLGQKIFETGLPMPLALSALATEPLARTKQRSTGAYHTDFRLAVHLIESAGDRLSYESTIMDPACGTGMLLAAATLAVCGSDRKRATIWLRDNVFAADLSSISLRGALLSLASFTSDIASLQKMRAKWLCLDSLIAPPEVWRKLAPRGFDVVIGNPPWEKVKTTRHEFLQASGDERHYGSEYSALDLAEYQAKRKVVGSYASALLSHYKCLNGEIDLYAAFLELSLAITKPDGITSIFVPGGLIRSQGTEKLRELIFSLSSAIKITVFENRARFFKIDSRFKFLAVTCVKQSTEGSRNAPLVIAHASGTSRGVESFARATIGRKALKGIRPDLTIPEVRGNDEWTLFLKMSRNGLPWGGLREQWKADIVREVDMTRDKRHFKRSNAHGLLPLIEGRMLHQHRFGAKAYLTGSGRRAIWRPVPHGGARLIPQFWISPDDLSKKALHRTQKWRAGFCDITGQTNERALLAAIVPPGVVCGNKVPTITFPDDPLEERLLLWVAIANSLPFDWLMRRIVTTTVNYFLLLGVPLPRISKDGLPGRQIIEAAKTLRDIDLGTSGHRSLWKVAELRCRIDVAVALAYGMNCADLALIMKDFTLLDRGQHPIFGEERSTITRDFFLMTAAKRLSKPHAELKRRVVTAKAAHAIPYVTAQYTNNDDTADAEHG